jgi:hypothetical protein
MSAPMQVSYLRAWLATGSDLVVSMSCCCYVMTSSWTMEGRHETLGSYSNTNRNAVTNTIRVPQCCQMHHSGMMSNIAWLLQ